MYWNDDAVIFKPLDKLGRNRSFGIVWIELFVKLPGEVGLECSNRFIFVVFRRAEFHDALISPRAFLIGGSWNSPLRLRRKPFLPCRDFAREIGQRQFIRNSDGGAA